MLIVPNVAVSFTETPVTILPIRLKQNLFPNWCLLIASILILGLAASMTPKTMLETGKVKDAAVVAEPLFIGRLIVTP